MDARYTFLPFGKLGEAREYPFVRPMLDAVEKRARHPGLARRLITQRDAKQSYMDVIYLDHSMVGVVVCTPFPDHLWVDALSIKSHTLTEEAERAINAHLDTRARQHGLKEIRTNENYRGAEKRMKRNGWKVAAVQYEREVV